MTGFQLQYDSAPEKKKLIKPTLEFYVPLEQGPTLQPSEIEAVYFGEAVSEIHVVKPALLYGHPKKGLSFEAVDDLDYYYLVAVLAKSSYLALLTVQDKDERMGKHFLANNLKKHHATYYIDAFHAPNFGAARMQNMLFEKHLLTAGPLPRVPLLFRAT